MMVELEESGQVPRAAVGVTRIWQLGVRVSQLIKERMDHGING